MTEERYQPDSRANHLEAWKLTRSGSAWFLQYRGVPAVTDHVLGILPRAKAVGTLSHDAQWPYRIRMDFNPDGSLAEFLDFLQEVLVIHIRQKGYLDAAIALDFYTRPAKNGSGDLVYTSTAQSIRLIKHYESAEQAEVDRAGQELCRSLSDAIVRHEWFNEATRILAVPGHARDKPSVSVLLGTLLSRELGIELTSVSCTTPLRKPGKLMSPRERATMLHEFRVDEDLAGETILVLDDVYHTGYTMAGVANAARRAGAGTVLGLAAARNLRR